MVVEGFAHSPNVRVRPVKPYRGGWDYSSSLSKLLNAFSVHS